MICFDDLASNNLDLVHFFRTSKQRFAHLTEKGKFDDNEDKKGQKNYIYYDNSAKMCQF